MSIQLNSRTGAIIPYVVPKTPEQVIQDHVTKIANTVISNNNAAAQPASLQGRAAQEPFLLENAIKRGASDTEILDLIEKGAKPALEQIIDLAISHNASYAVILKLQKIGAKIHGSNEGLSTLNLAFLMKASLRTVGILLNQGALKLESKVGESINYAIMQSAPSEVIALLIRFGTSINSETPKLILDSCSEKVGIEFDQRFNLIECVSNPYYFSDAIKIRCKNPDAKPQEVAELLIKYFPENPLKKAIKFEASSEVIKALISQGNKLTTKHLSIARDKQSSVEIVELLLKGLVFGDESQIINTAIAGMFSETMIEQLLKKGHSFTKDSFPIAIMQRSKAVLKFLVDHGAMITEKISSTVFNEAIELGSPDEVITFLLELGVTIDELTPQLILDRLSFDLAVEFDKHFDLLWLICKHGVNLENREEYIAKATIVRSIRYHLDPVEEALSQKCALSLINYVNKQITAKHIESARDKQASAEVVVLLIKAFNNNYLKINNDKGTNLVFNEAIVFNFSDQILLELLNLGYKPDHYSLMNAILQLSSAKVFKLLFKNGVSFENTVDDPIVILLEKSSLLSFDAIKVIVHKCAKKDPYYLVNKVVNCCSIDKSLQILLSAGLQVDQTRTIEIALNKTYTSARTLQLLLNAGPKPNQGTGLIAYALEKKRSLEIIQTLLSVRAKIHPQSQLIELALRFGASAQVVQALTDKGAKVDYLGSSLALARKLKVSDDVVEVLKLAGSKE